MITIRKERQFNDEVRYIVNELEQAFLRGKEPAWKTTREFSEMYNKYYDYTYRLIRAAADFWNQNLANDYKVMFDCDYHGYRWRFHKSTQELEDLCWIAALRTEGHNKRSLSNFGYAGEINPNVKKDIKFGTAKVVVPSRFKDYENNES